MMTHLAKRYVFRFGFKFWFCISSIPFNPRKARDNRLLPEAIKIWKANPRCSYNTKLPSLEQNTDNKIFGI